MTPEREKEIRSWVELRYGASCKKVFDCFEELLAEIDGLREALSIYGGHCGGCNSLKMDAYMDMVYCSCGFRQIWNEQKLQDVIDARTARLSRKPEPERLPE